MSEFLQIDDLEQVYYRLEKMIAELVILREFVLSKLPGKNAGKPKNRSMIDPRTGKPFGSKTSSTG